jgi:hypothetical protein
VNILEALGDNPSFQDVIKQAVAVPEVVSSPEPVKSNHPARAEGLKSASLDGRGKGEGELGPKLDTPCYTASRPKLETASEPEADPVLEPPISAKPHLNCSSCNRHDDGWCYFAATRTFYNIELLEACPLNATAPEPAKPKYGCNSCDSHHNGWCRAVPRWPFYNIKFLKACPLIVSIPEAKRLQLTYGEYQ